VTRNGRILSRLAYKWVGNLTIECLLIWRAGYKLWQMMEGIPVDHPSTPLPYTHMVSRPKESENGATKGHRIGMSPSLLGLRMLRRSMWNQIKGAPGVHVRVWRGNVRQACRKQEMEASLVFYFCRCSPELTLFRFDVRAYSGSQTLKCTWKRRSRMCKR